MNWLKYIYSNQMFFPGWLGIFVNPFYLARAGLCEAITQFAPRLNGRLLDVGCGTKPYQRLFRTVDYVGLDIDSNTSRQRGIADFFYSGDIFPFDNISFDSVICNQVLEHVFNPDEFLGEIVRVLKPGGKLLLTVPFVWDEHEQPHDYARYSSFGLHRLLEKQGLRILDHNKIGADASIIFQLANAYFYKIIQSLPKPIKLVLTVSIMAMINMAGIIASQILPKNPDLFLDHVILAEKTY